MMDDELSVFDLVFDVTTLVVALYWLTKGIALINEMITLFQKIGG